MRYAKILIVQLNNEDYVEFMLDPHDVGYKGRLLRYITGDKQRAEFGLSFPKKERVLRNKIN